MQNFYVHLEDAALLDFFRRLGAIRRENPQDFRRPLQFAAAAEGAAAYRRGTLLAAVNRSERACTLPFHGEVLLAVGELRQSDGVLTLQPDSGVILRV